MCNGARLVCQETSASEYSGARTKDVSGHRFPRSWLDTPALTIPSEASSAKRRLEENERM